MNRFRQSVKTGDAGEKLAEALFPRYNMRMFRVQPASRIVKMKSGEARLIHCGEGGISDYIGYQETWPGPRFVACEVKTARAKAMPCSRLGTKQRAWMDTLPEGSAWVGIYWIDYGEFQLYQYKPKGSYHKR